MSDADPVLTLTKCSVCKKPMTITGSEHDSVMKHWCSLECAVVLTKRAYGGPAHDCKKTKVWHGSSVPEGLITSAVCPLGAAGKTGTYVITVEFYEDEDGDKK